MVTLKILFYGHLQRMLQSLGIILDLLFGHCLIHLKDQISVFFMIAAALGRGGSGIYQDPVPIPAITLGPAYFGMGIEQRRRISIAIGIVIFQPDGGQSVPIIHIIERDEP